MNKVTFEKVEDLSFQANEAYKSLRTNYTILWGRREGDRVYELHP